MTKRYFLKDIPNVGKTASLEEEEHHHLKHVMRKKIDHKIELFDGKGLSAIATIESIEKNHSRLKILSQKKDPKKAYALTLFQALIKPQSIEELIEKVTEIGIDRVVFFPSKHSEIQILSKQKHNRLDTIVLNSCKQSYRNTFLEIQVIPSLKDAMALCQNGVVGSLSQTSTIIPKKDMGIWVGPEGGFTREEEELLLKKYTPFKLHQNVLRAKTAAMCLSSHFEYLLAQTFS
ncbi:MAG: Ribosomal RNA small subunit methyltransferase E [Chlamydiae bacterium]|nr:Ribosomal RNA small subunit methyltransferase E [Chlamydiota bacterium]